MTRYLVTVFFALSLLACGGSGGVPTAVTPIPAPAQKPRPEPVTPEPTTPEPVTPEPTTPEPVTPEPTTPEPVTPEPTTPEPVTPEPTTPEPTNPQPARPTTSEQLSQEGVASTYDNALTGLESAGTDFDTAPLLAELQQSASLQITTNSPGPLPDPTDLPTPTVEQALSDGHYVAAVDTNAPDAWRLGWTGKGVKIGVLDTFTTENLDVYKRALRTHGDATSFVAQQVAPEATIGKRGISFGCETPGSTIDREIRSGYAYFEANGYHIVNNSWSISRYNTGVCPDSQAGVISEANWNTHIDSTQRNDVPFRKLALPTGSSESYDVNMLFVFSAGNDGGPDPETSCPYGTGGCNLYASTILSMRQTSGLENSGDRVIFVGSLADGQENVADADKVLASYSAHAGTMKNDYIVAHDDIFVAGYGAGTSFAAPRVSGAAALVRHKFPSLDGPGLKGVLLQSADDLGVPGVDEEFGYGRLNVMGALSPIGNLVSE